MRLSKEQQKLWTVGMVYLRRAVKDAETRAEVDHKGWAKEGLDYATRQRRVEMAAKSDTEAEGLRFVLNVLQDME